MAAREDGDCNPTLISPTVLYCGVNELLVIAGGCTYYCLAKVCLSACCLHVVGFQALKDAALELINSYQVHVLNGMLIMATPSQFEDGSMN